MSSSHRVAKAASWVSLWCVGVALAGCPQPFVERIPTVVAPVAPGCNEEGNEEEAGTVTPVARAPTSVASSRLWAHAGCQASTVSTLARHVAVMQPDGGMVFLDLVSEQRIDSSREVDSTGSFCRVVVQTRVWQEKDGVRLEVPPITADVTLCDARLTSPDASALVAAGARATLQRVDVGATALDGPVELAALLTEPRDMPITASPSSTSCGDGEDVTERIDRYAHAEHLVVRFPLKDAPRFAWSSAIELDFEVRAVSRR
jgi:hypothetical protein